MVRSLKKFLTAFLTFSVALGIGLAMQYGDAFAARWAGEAPAAGPVPEKTVSAQNAAAVMPQSMLVVPRGLSDDEQRLQTASMSSLPEEVAVPVLLAPAASGVAPQGEPTTAAYASKDDVPAAPDASPVIATSETPVALESEPKIEVAALDLQADASLPSGSKKLEDDTLGETTMSKETTGTDRAPYVGSCVPQLTATPSPLAMVTLELANTCRAEERVVIHHQGMMFSALTDKSGHMTTLVPALEEEAFFIASFDDGEGAVALTGVPDLAKFDRAVLQWQGQATVGLHALEFGAGYDQAGHIWAMSAGNTVKAAAGTGGFLTQLGNSDTPNALMAEVYTFPTGYVSQDGAVALSVEAEVTKQNCGRDVAAQSIQIEPGEDHTALDLTMTMPACDAIGEFLVLKNMFTDLNLAAK